MGRSARKNRRVLPAKRNRSPSTGSDDLKVRNLLENSSTTSSEDSAPLRPPISYSCLIREALCSSPEFQLPLSGIYEYIQSKYPYFQTASAGWKNSIRHNLSLSRAFLKVPSSILKSKASLWKLIDAQIPPRKQAKRVIPFLKRQLSTRSGITSNQEHYATILPKALEPRYCPSEPMNVLFIEPRENSAFKNDVFLGAKTPELNRGISTPELPLSTHLSM